MLRLQSGCVERCPGCDHRALDDAHSLEIKRSRVVEAFRDLCVDPLGAVDPIRSAERWGYRKKSVLAARWADNEGCWHFGMQRVPEGLRWARPSKREVIPIHDCPIQTRLINRTLSSLSQSLPPDLPLVYVAVCGQLLTLVLSAKRVPDQLPLIIERLDPSSLGLVGVLVNLHPSAGNHVFASKGWRLLWGESRARDAQGLWYGPGSFQQLIAGLHSDALNEASSFLRGGAGVVDLCSGIGASLLRWNTPSLGVELGGEAVECSRLNLGDSRVLRGKASERIPQIREWCSRLGGGAISVYANPPRTGLELEVIDWLARESRVQRLAYLSCSPGTLSRDLTLLVRQGFRVEKVIPYDFFPQTSHVETLALVGRSRALGDHPLDSRSNARTE